MLIKTEAEMLKFGENFAKNLKPTQNLIELVGDVGVGKTTFVRGLAKGLGIKSPVTSPSFTISKNYLSPSGKTLTHYDFYRLDDLGLMTDDLLDSLNIPGSLTVIEWGKSVSDLLPPHLILHFKLHEDGSREIIS